MKTVTKSDIARAKKFIERINRLQGDIYNWTSDIEDKGLNAADDFASTAGIELDECRIEMEKCLSSLEHSYKALHPHKYQ